MVLILTDILFTCFQGTVLDRIDYNIESTSTKVQEGLKQLQKVRQEKSCLTYTCPYGFTFVTLL